MSHELRTPLNAIIGYAEILLEGGLDDDSAADAGRIRTSGKHLLSLINDVLDLSRIEAGKIALLASDIELSSLLGEVVETVRPRAEGNGNTLELRVPGDLGTVCADPMRVRQVLLNLLSNAAKFTTDGTVVLEAVRQVQAGREVVRLAVRDTGIGISEAQLARLFRPFAQADDSTVRKFGGSGLGLVLSKRLAEMMEGELLVDSELGAGSSFTFVLPVSTAAGRIERLTPLRAAEAAAADQRVVLCVDDDPHILEQLDRILSAEGMFVVPCQRPSGALELARMVRPAAILLDLHMPELDGSVLLEQLRRDPELAGVPVVVVSIDAEARRRTLAADAWMQKPVQRSELLALIEAHCPEGDGPVLIVEDDPATRDVVRKTLTRHGLAVIEACNGFEALAILQSVRPRIVLLDLMMPGMDGFTVVDRLGQQPGFDVPVVVLTSADLDERDRQRLAAARRILTKTPDVLDDIVDQVRLAAAS